MRKRLWAFVLIGLLLVAWSPVWPEQNQLAIAQRFGRDKVSWSMDGDHPFIVSYPVSIIISAKVAIPAGVHSTSTGHYLPTPFRGDPVAQVTVLFDNYGVDYIALPTIAIATLSNQAIILAVTRPIPSDLAAPCVVRYFLQLTGEY